ncbi:MAG: DinB family protein [Phycisphaerales bacterium]
MLEHERTLYAFNLGYLKAMVPQIPSGSIAVPVCPGGVTPGWIIGHLCVSADGAAQLLGGTKTCPADWGARFGPGTEPSTDPAAYPPLEQLLSVYERAHGAVLAAAERVSRETLATMHSIPFFANTPIKTVGEAAALLMTVHEGIHLGQLTVWRRQHGHVPLF